MTAPLTEVKENWQEFGRQLVAMVEKSLRSMAPLMVAHYTLPDLKGRFVHRHKGRARRQHKMPPYRKMWIHTVEQERRRREGKQRGTSNTEVAVG